MSATFMPLRPTLDEEAEALARDLIDALWYVPAVTGNHDEALIPRLREACSSNERGQAFLAALHTATGNWLTGGEE